MAAMRPSRSFWIAFALLNALLLSLLFALWQFRAERAELALLDELGAALYPEPIPLAQVELTDHRSQPFELERMRDTWSLVFFGFSNCPDMCPATLAQLERFYRDYRDEPALAQPPVQVLFVSVDPADTPEIIAEYLGGFHADFVGLAGSVDAVHGFAGQLFVNTGMAGHGGHAAPHASPDGFISHSVHIGVINPAGELAGLLRPPHRAASIAQALEMIFQRT